ncbi:uncharacterized protein CLUP02_16415 [Colletotrichum lupini]|uniref:Uncharacterized protein n=1 Tax=Colletotrichum lupini TaxID=145971 RepID=A0A9Q8T7X4_9PEZI|nr:uncharacterized protein CLUP02_16415 [Colletotrichum lupini]UQC90883.1 hypothetical protein CLUP02_16415 [Colletotrichum lupini]
MHQQINHRPAEVVSAWWSVISFKADVRYATLFVLSLRIQICDYEYKVPARGSKFNSGATQRQMPKRQDKFSCQRSMGLFRIALEPAWLVPYLISRLDKVRVCTRCAPMLASTKLHGLKFHEFFSRCKVALIVRIFARQLLLLFSTPLLDQKRHRSQAPTRRSCTMTSDSIPSRSSHVRWNAPPQIREGWCGLLQVDRAHLTSYMNGLTWSFFFNTAIPLKPAGARSSSIIIIIIIIRFKLAFEAFESIYFSAIILQWKKHNTEYGPGPEQSEASNSWIDDHPQFSSHSRIPLAAIFVNEPKSPNYDSGRVCSKMNNKTAGSLIHAGWDVSPILQRRKSSELQLGSPAQSWPAPLVCFGALDTLALPRIPNTIPCSPRTGMAEASGPWPNRTGMGHPWDVGEGDCATKVQTLDFPRMPETYCFSMVGRPCLVDHGHIRCHAMSCYTLDSCPFSVTALGALDARSLDTKCAIVSTKMPATFVLPSARLLWMPDRSPIPKKLAALDSHQSVINLGVPQLCSGCLSPQHPRADETSTSNHQPMPSNTVHHPTRGLFTSASCPASREAVGEVVNYRRHKPYRFSSEEPVCVLTRQLNRAPKDFKLPFQSTAVVDLQLSRRWPSKLSSFVNDIGPQLTDSQPTRFPLSDSQLVIFSSTFTPSRF